MARYQFYEKKTCVTCQKAKAFLETQGIVLEVIPIEKNPPPRKLLEKLVDPQDVKASLNVRSAIYKEKKLGDKTPNPATAIDLMLQDPNLIRRPVLVNAQGEAILGFDGKAYTAFLNR